MRIKIPNWFWAIILSYMVYTLASIVDRAPDIERDKPLLFSEIDDVRSNINVFKQKHLVDDESLTCLAKNVYFEARNQSIVSQLAVSEVVMNRVQDENFPNTVCGVIYEAQHSTWYKEKMNKVVPIKNRCQFSWYCDGKPDEINDQMAWKIAKTVARQVLTGYNENLTNGALWYHAYYVNPKWAQEKTKTVEHEDHIFYRTTIY